MTTEQAILKAQQVMRDYKRPDRLELKLLQQQAASQHYSQGMASPLLEAGGLPHPPASLLPHPLKPPRTRAAPSTPLEGVVDFLSEPNPETDDLFSVNPFGVHAHDVLSGRGAYVNGHVGNARLRALAMERKPQFDAGNYTEKRVLAAEIVAAIKALDPPGRFLKKASKELQAEYQAQQDRLAKAAEEAQEPQQAREPPQAPTEGAANEEAAAKEDERATGGDPATKTEHADPAVAGNGAEQNGETEASGDAARSSAPAVAPGTAEEIGTAGVDALFKAAEKAQQTGAETVAVPVANAPQGPETPLVQVPGTAQPKQAQAQAQQEPPAPATALVHLVDGVWEELSDDKAIHKACQVMRDISRPDRKYREERREQRLQRKQNKRQKLLGRAGSSEAEQTGTGVAVGVGAGVGVGVAETEGEGVAAPIAPMGDDGATAMDVVHDANDHPPAAAVMAASATATATTTTAAPLVATHPQAAEATAAATGASAVMPTLPIKAETEDDALTAEGEAAVQVVDNALLDETAAVAAAVPAPAVGTNPAGASAAMHPAAPPDESMPTDAVVGQIEV
ncbi:unnamed protein product [Pseudo-nitzschia multistriata]|uniref:DUF6824 domain-containing protein n=1 Tax=Pseudo-nitzschia multistriata TaxID=183589 RepID=A0A448ZPD0_9STRA|nr:unnamed protein product [Pseudo-nitzschia multistriata]